MKTFAHESSHFERHCCEGLASTHGFNLPHWRLESNWFEFDEAMPLLFMIEIMIISCTLFLCSLEWWETGQQTSKPYNLCPWFELILKEVFGHQVSGKDTDEQLVRLQQGAQSTAKYSLNFKHGIGCRKWKEWDSTENHVLAWTHRSATERNTMPSSSALTQPIYSASHLHNPHSTNPPSNENNLENEVESKETVTCTAIRRVQIVLE